MASTTHKRGDTFDKVLTLANAQSGDYVGWTATCQIRKSTGTFIDNLTVTWENHPVRTILRLFKLDTKSWPIGDDHIIDVQLTRDSDNYVRSTETIVCAVTLDVTIPTV